jgi:hypothetical protein
MQLPTHGDFKQYMIQYIREHFKEMLGEHAALLDQEDGLDRLSSLVRSGAVGAMPRL